MEMVSHYEARRFAASELDGPNRICLMFERGQRGHER